MKWTEKENPSLIRSCYFGGESLAGSLKVEFILVSIDFANGIAEPPSAEVMILVIRLEFALSVFWEPKLIFDIN